MPLTDRAISSAKPEAKARKIFDERGLFLLISPKGGKWWRFKYRFDGKEKQLSLGTYPLVSLTEARTKRDKFRALLKGGTDPSNQIKAEREERLAEEVRQLAATRFTLESDGGLTLRLGKRFLALTPVETIELHSFLHYD